MLKPGKGRGVALGTQGIHADRSPSAPKRLPIPWRHRWSSYYGGFNLNFSLVIIKDDEPVFLCLLAICLSSLLKCLFTSFASFFFLKKD